MISIGLGYLDSHVLSTKFAIDIALLGTQSLDPLTRARRPLIYSGRTMKRTKDTPSGASGKTD